MKQQGGEIRADEAHAFKLSPVAQKSVLTDHEMLPYRGTGCRMEGCGLVDGALRHGARGGPAHPSP
jgi:hypothetical protein